MTTTSTNESTKGPTQSLILVPYQKMTPQKHKREHKKLHYNVSVRILSQVSCFLSACFSTIKDDHQKHQKKQKKPDEKQKKKTDPERKKDRPSALTRGDRDTIHGAFSRVFSPDLIALI